MDLVYLFLMDLVYLFLLHIKRSAFLFLYKIISKQANNTSLVLFPNLPMLFTFGEIILSFVPSHYAALPMRHFNFEYLLCSF